MIESVVRYIKNGKFANDLVFEKILEEQKGSFVDLEIIENQIFKETLKEMGISHLYSHQAKAYKLIKEGKNVLITTPTASGKTLCYNLPILEDIYLNGSKALYLFPIKALGYDQKEKLEDFANKIPLFDFKVEVIDGDTDKKKRRKILTNPPDIIISNVDILHYSILPKITEWETFLKDLKYIVVDELHIYRGVFGSHVRNIFQRLKRFLPHLQIITASATIGNAKEFARDLFDIDFEHINENGAPSSKKYFLFFNPETVPAANLSSYFMKIFIESGIKTLCFTKSRIQTETIYRRLISDVNVKKDSISSYRAGFLPEERRAIEKNFRDGKLKGVIATSAFELGIDIGGIDATIILGFPGSLMSLWQRAGRGGRNGNESLIILIATNDALDQYFVKNPDKLLSSSFEDALIDIDNEIIQKQHIQCAAFEKPISNSEYYYNHYSRIIDNMLESKELFQDEENRVIVTFKNYPHKEVDLRASGNTYTIMMNNIIIGTNSAKKAYTENHIGAIYLHRGETFIVEKIDHSKREIHVKPANPNYYTRPLVEKQTAILKIHKETNISNFNCKYVDLLVTEHLTGYEKIAEKTGEKLGKVDIETEPIQFETKGIVIEIPETQLIGNLMGSIHAIEHAIIAMIPTEILCDRNDIGGISYPAHPQTGKISIFLYDGYPGGIGITKRVFDKIEKILQITLLNIKNCQCETGCPACIISPKCGSGNYPLDKNGATALLEFILNKKSDTKKVSNSVHKDDILVFDIETKYSANEVGGWKNAHKMGVAILVAYSFKKDDYLIFYEKDMRFFEDIIKNAKALIGFNIINFDFKVLSAYLSINKKHSIILDILHDIKNITGKRFSLNNIAKATLNIQKCADGLQSLQWYKEGNFDKIIEYCKKDVEITYKVFEYGIQHKKVYCDNKGLKITIPVNWNYVFM
ncbi:DEAD/DEAH box helicase [Deferribacter autotrophicus]|uniref:DEAD/DEAH box helicase n=1 Tax=Deferribacter autotrophicus TaxID=500465 RepID=A0A5A8F103_9BACT|nr:DEAD/DEAH box helicase [Deferribacter autotrophicus]KAA0257071.1 DEAD/DEAH box helicase [Deferribacter autotrophicus]